MNSETLRLLDEMHAAAINFAEVNSERKAAAFDTAYKQLRALLSAQEDGWRPIETAPEDDMVIVCVQGRGPVVAHVIAGKWTLYVPGTPMLFQPALVFTPTHWMPIPGELAKQEAK